MTGIKESLTSRFTGGPSFPSSLSRPFLKISHPHGPFSKPGSSSSSSSSGFGWAAQQEQWGPQWDLPGRRICSQARGDLQDFLRDGPKCTPPKHLGHWSDHSPQDSSEKASTLMLHPMLKWPLHLGHRACGMSLGTSDSLGQRGQLLIFKVISINSFLRLKNFFFRALKSV